MLPIESYSKTLTLKRLKVTFVNVTHTEKIIIIIVVISRYVQSFRASCNSVGYQLSTIDRLSVLSKRKI